MDNIKFTIIIPAYNVERWILECLESVKSQTYKTFECIIVNDGSSDNSQEIISNYIKNDDRFILIAQKNQGSSSARNKGIESAIGDYIIFLDGDDRLKHNTLAYYASLINNQEHDVYCTTCKSITSSGSSITQFNQGNQRIINIRDGIKELLNHTILTGVWGKAYRKSIIQDIRFKTNCTLGEDLFFNLELFLSSSNGSIYIDNYITTEYRILSSSISHRKGNETLIRTKQFINEFQNLRKEITSILTDKENNILNREILSIILQTFNQQGVIKRADDYILENIILCQNYAWDNNDLIFKTAYNLLSSQFYRNTFILTVKHLPKYFKNSIKNLLRNWNLK